jgi:co-chaperonin GroES (HSP10)
MGVAAATKPRKTSDPAKPLRVISNESILTRGSRTEFSWDSIDEAFPKVDPGLKPFGTVVLVQVRHPKKRTKGGIILVEDARSTEYYNTQIAKVIAMGPLCFKASQTRDNAEGRPEMVLVDWAEGPWFEVGDFVRIPQYGGDRFTAPHKVVDFEVDEETGAKEKVTLTEDIVFALFKAKDILGLISGDNVLTVKSFFD